KELYESDANIARLLDTARALEGMPRHASTHAAGVVITDKEVSSYVPLATNGDTTVTQFDMDTVAELGLVKFDFLGLRYLTIISEAEELIKKTNPDFDIYKIPFDDKATYSLISAGQTGGVFQLESKGMKQVLTELRPEKIDDVIAAIALYRPGPMDSIPMYIERRHGRQTTEYKYAALERILSKTYGCIVYQEQVMQIFCEIAGYTLGKADIVRRAMSKKKASVMEAERAAFVLGATARGMSESDAVELFEDMASFASYAFNKSHAASYAVVTYRTAYLKAHYMAEYMAALLTSVLGDFGKTAEYISECSKAKISVLPPDINESISTFGANNGVIRFGLLALKGVGRLFVEQIISERAINGKFKSFEDFIVRMGGYDLNKRQVESLIKSGAFDNLGVYRSQLLATYEKIIENAQSKRRFEVDGQIDFFSMVDNTADFAPVKFDYPSIPEFTLREKLMLEKECSGMYFSGHILNDYSKHIEAVRADSISEILASFEDEENAGKYRDKQTVNICGIITKRTVKATRNGDNMAFVSVEDKTGEMEAVVFSKQFERFSGLLFVESAVVLGGTVSVKDDEPPKILLNSCVPLIPNESYSDKKPQTLYIKVPSAHAKVTETALSLIGKSNSGADVVLFDVQTGKYVKAVGYKATLSNTLLNSLSGLFGSENIVIK
ncbi:MAG: DNA polymerase III subunit alpha, partial [Ruminococcaceae bacterium]|nr:DNA polymerase III subunit alpha [Oscillospiraceae bacterium]